MVLEYFTLKRHKKGKEPQDESAVKSPVLTEEDAEFLHRLAAEAPFPPNPSQPSVILDNGKEIRGEEAQAALLGGAHDVPLPTSPHEVDKQLEEGASSEAKSGDVKDSKESKKRTYLSYLPTIPGRAWGKDKDKKQAGDDLHAAAEAHKSGGDSTAGQDDKKDEEDLASVLDQLNLSAVNNRVFSFSKESHELMERFTQVLKDIVNGVPTAYDDLEKLLTQSEGQLDKMFGGMPPFLQTLVKSLPSRMTSSFGPEILAMASEKPSVKVQEAKEDDGGKVEGDAGKKKKRRIPSLRSMVSDKGAVVGMLRSILSFLKLRFPAFMTGTNVLMSLSMFILLFVFWYCHKRGKETRLAREAEGKNAATSDIEVSDVENSPEIKASEKEGEASGTVPEQSAQNENETQPKLEDADAKLNDMPSVLDLPEPQSVPLPAEPHKA